MATHSSILAWGIPWTEEPGGLQFVGLQRVGHDLMINHLVLIIDSFNVHREEKVVLAITGINKTRMKYSNIWRVLSLGIL